MKKIITLAIFCSCVFQATSQSTFQILLGDSGRDVGNLDVYESADSGCITSVLSRKNNSTIADLPRIVITKLDKRGAITWSKYHDLPEIFNKSFFPEAAIAMFCATELFFSSIRRAAA